MPKLLNQITPNSITVSLLLLQQKQQAPQRQTLFLDLENPVFVFLRQKNSNNWTWSVWILENVACANPEALSCTRGGKQKKRCLCFVPRWKLKSQPCLPRLQSGTSEPPAGCGSHCWNHILGHLLYGRQGRGTAAHWH